MILPKKFPGLRLFLIIWGVYTAVWISLEGTLWRVVLMGTGTTLLMLGNLVQRYVGGRTVRPGTAVLVTAVSGLIFGGGSAIFSLIFMALKTGLHAHGPEFSQAEIIWVWGQLPLWTAVGTLIGLGIGLIWAGRGKIN